MESTQLAQTINSVSIDSVLESLGKKDRKIIEIESHTHLQDALKILAQYRILSAPVWDKLDGDYIGFIDVLDIVSFAIEMYSEGNKMEPRSWGFPDFHLLTHRGIRFGLKNVSEVINTSKANQFVPVFGSATLSQLIEGVLEKGIHRVPIRNEIGRIKNFLSQSDIIEYLAKNDLITDVKYMTVEQLGLGTIGNIIAMNVRAQAIHAFYLMHFHKVSAVAITGHDGTLVANLSASDIRGLAGKQLDELLLPVAEYLLMQRAVPPVTCTLNSTFDSVVFKLTTFRLHRVWIVDAQNKPIGLISLTDVMKRFAQAAQ